VRSGVYFGQHIPCRICIIKAAQHIGDGENEGIPDPGEDHVVMTILFNHATDECSIFFSYPLDRNSDCTSTILLEHAIFKKTTHNLRLI